MIGLVIAASMLAQNAEPSVPDTQVQIEQEVRNMNDQLKHWSASIDPSGGADNCRTISSTGDPQLDALACEAMSDCAKRMRPMTSRLDDPTVSETEKDKLAVKASGTMTTCVFDRRLELFKGLAATRVKAAQGAPSK